MKPQNVMRVNRLNYLKSLKSDIERAEFESDAYVNNVFHFILTKTGCVRLTAEYGYSYPIERVKEHEIIMGVLYGYLNCVEFGGQG